MNRLSVVVTGACGYLGGRLVQSLCADGHMVTGTSRGERVAPPGWPEAARLVRLDPAADLEVLAEALGGADVVIHLAAANEVASARDPEQAVRDTGLGTWRLLQAAIQARVRRFVFLSTIHVYGAPLRGRLDEGVAARPGHPYAISHRLGEDFVLAARDAGRIEGVVIRLSNGIGAPVWRDVDRWTLVGNDLARQAVETGRLQIKTPGQWRDFITLPDFCQGVSTLSLADAEALDDGLFNLGGNLLLRIADVARATAAAAELVLGRPIAIDMPEIGANEPAAFDFRIDKLERLGFLPTGDRFLRSEMEASLRLLT